MAAIPVGSIVVRSRSRANRYPLRYSAGRRPLAALLGVAVVLLASCGERDPVTNDRAQRLAEEWLVSTTGAQARLLKDHVVSVDEYRMALEAVRECVVDHGMRATPLQPNPDGIRLEFALSSDTANATEIGAVWDECWRSNAEAVESVFLAQQALPATERDDLDDDLVQCLDRAGVPDVPTGLSDAALFDRLVGSNAPNTAWTCRERYMILLGRVGATPPTQ